MKKTKKYGKVEMLEYIEHLINQEVEFQLIPCFTPLPKKTFKGYNIEIQVEWTEDIKTSDKYQLEWIDHNWHYFDNHLLIWFDFVL